MPNRLASETSPYLLQHADNPVDWYPWGDEAFARARDEDKPVLVSIGYAACHWCHVMEHESFEDASVAALMNEQFVCVKVDREERPDVDAIYMDAVQAMTGQGGWPLNAFLTPEGVPFWAGTYFPPQPRQRAAVLARRAGRVAGTAWVDAARRDRRRRRATSCRGCRARRLWRRRTRVRPGGAGRGRRGPAARSFDREYGGWGGAPKFPTTSVIEFLLARGERAMPLQTLRRMASGGIYDQIGGGFARYSVDAQLARPALREDALRQRAAGARVPARLAGRRTSRCSGGCARRRWTGRCASCGRTRAGSRRRWMRIPRASRASSTCGRRLEIARR